MIIGIDASRTTRAHLTGTEYYALHLIRHLISLDYTNHYRLFYNTPPVSEKFTGSNISNSIIQMPRMWTQARLALECLLHKPDILFIPSHTMPIIRRPSLKTVVTIHDLGAEYLPEYHKFPQRLYLNRSTEYVAGHATHIIAVSEATKKDLQEKFGVSSDRVTVVYEGVDRDTFSIIRDRNRLKKVQKKYALPDKFILFVGTIQPRKNLITLIEAFDMLRANAVAKEYELVLVGKHGWLADDIYAHPKKLGIERQVRFLDYVDGADLPALYNLASLFVFPSLYEGFGLPVLEAMACGCPVIGSNISSVPEVVGDSELLFDPKKSQEIAALSIKMLTQTDFRHKKIHHGDRQASLFSWQKSAQETLRVFEKVYSQNKY